MELRPKKSDYRNLNLDTFLQLDREDRQMIINDNASNNGGMANVQIMNSIQHFNKMNQ